MTIPLATSKADTRNDLCLDERKNAVVEKAIVLRPKTIPPVATSTGRELLHIPSTRARTNAAPASPFAIRSLELFIEVIILLALVVKDNLNHEGGN
jgi:hypothetical protein